MGNAARCLLMLCLATTAAYDTGCSLPKGPSLPAEGSPAIVPTPPDEAVAAGFLTGLGPRRGKVRITRKGRPAYTASFTVEPHQDGWRFSIETMHTAYLRQNADGALDTMLEEDHEEQVAVSYEPPFVMLPASLVPGVPARFECRMNITDLRSGAPRDRGHCAYRIELLERRNQAEPNGPVVPYVVRTTRDITLRMARARVVTEVTFVPGRGLVREHTRQTVLPLGLFRIEKEYDIRVIE